MVASYAETVAWLQRLEASTGWDLKLERMRAALAARGHPERAWRALHVAGTNGKGSVAATAEAVLRAAGRRTALYTSPHLVDFAERIRAGGRTIPQQAVVELVGELRQALERRGIGLTHFEFVTLLAFEWFARIGVEAAVIEVGLGGRLDATNTVEPLVTAVTSIALDHEEWLGHDLRQIAGEKGGIAKPGVPMVLGRLPREADEAIAARAAAVGAPVLRAGRDGWLRDAAFETPDGVRWARVAAGLAGGFQRANAEVALLALHATRAGFGVDEAAVRAGLAAVDWPGRLAVLCEAPRVVVDGAHNPAGAAALAAELPRLLAGRRTVLVFAVMADKAWPAMLAALRPHADRVIATRIGGRGLDPAAIASGAPPGARIEIEPDAAAAVRRALDEAAPGDAVLIAGSLFLAGVAYATLRPGAPLFEPWRGWVE